MEIGATVGAAPEQNAGTALGTEAAEEQGLDRNAFLRLLLTQLANQDPLDPIKDQAFVAQLAQFSSLERLEEISTSVETLVSLTEAGAQAPESTLLDFSEG